MAKITCSENVTTENPNPWEMRFITYKLIKIKEGRLKETNN